MLALKRIIKAGWKDFKRNLGLSLAAVFIMTVVISLASLLFLLRPVSQILISDIEEKVDVSVYFKEDVSAEQIFQVKTELCQVYQVKEAEYVSRDQALENFIEKHKDDSVLMESLNEVGQNPFLASLNVKAQEASQYEEIARFLEADQYQELIEKVDYYQRKPVIDKLFATIAGLNRIGFFFGIVFGLIAVLIVFNTIKMAIYNSGEEISIMRLVGASNWFIRGPFLAQGIFIGFIAALLALLIILAVCWGFDSRIKEIAPAIGLLKIFSAEFWLLFLVQLGLGIGLGIISSSIAIRKYLKI